MNSGCQEQAEPTALADVFCRKERIEYPLDDILRHTAAGVAYSQQYILPA